MRSLITIHSRGFVIKGDDGVCRARKFEPDGTTRIVDESYCDVAGAKQEATSSGLGNISPPLGYRVNGVSPVCIQSFYENVSPVPESLRGMPRLMYAEVPMYGTNMWLVTHSQSSNAWSAIETPLTKSQVLALNNCVAWIAPTASKGDNKDDATFDPAAQNFTSIVKSIDWRIAVAVGIIVALVIYGIYSTKK